MTVLFGKDLSEQVAKILAGTGQIDVESQFARCGEVALTVVDEEGLFGTHPALIDHPSVDLRRGFQQVHLVGEEYLFEIVLQRQPVLCEEYLPNIGENYVIDIRKGKGAE